MIKPIVTLGNKILRQKCDPVEQQSNEIAALITDMQETLHTTNGVGLAAPQVNSNLQLFIVKTDFVYNEIDEVNRKRIFPDTNGIEETFINAQITERSSETWIDEEGCLSIPDIYEQVTRPWQITIDYQDHNFDRQTKTFSGYNARVIQHEFDHIQGKLFIDHISSLRKKLIRSRIMRILNGKVKTSYAIFVTNK